VSVNDITYRMPTVQTVFTIDHIPTKEYRYSVVGEVFPRTGEVNVEKVINESTGENVVDEMMNTRWASQIRNKLALEYEINYQ